MALHFLVDDPAALLSDEVELTGPEAHHAATVRRVRVGETVTIGDGQGAWHTGEVLEVAPKRVLVRITERTTVPLEQPSFVLVQALAKGDRDEMAVQAATELGVDEIVPWQAKRSVSRWEGPKQAKGVQRWRTIVREAAKQAHRAHLPHVSDPEGIDALVRRAGAENALMLVLEPSATARLTEVELPADGTVVLVVGPEGGIAPEELERLRDAGARVVKLGDTVLRTSTAGPAALAAASVALGRW
ncbi:16S rRNA (uracil(1498)-N(3))-methyltransferase [Microbacterium gorillae]|uniref:16S rRNA (uracil(1498)-N(3))-methyltransferase n=1 Tax=Microbacterium gorillae TaxID=1231063 RepID=UPI00058FD7B1|nr:16S rRNA (uracil(1498)-N(3))-methyltransferase [Microbacterium gorillae]